MEPAPATTLLLWSPTVTPSLRKATHTLHTHWLSLDLPQPCLRVRRGANRLLCPTLPLPIQFPLPVQGSLPEVSSWWPRSTGDPLGVLAALQGSLGLRRG